MQMYSTHKTGWNISLLGLLLIVSMENTVCGQPNGYLYDESRVPKFELPDPLVFNNGDRVTEKSQWAKRRKEIFEFFESNVYGKAPTTKPKVSWGKPESKKILDGKGIMDQVKVKLTAAGPEVDVLIFRPAGQAPVPAFLGLNFMGNHTVFDDPDIWITKSWVRNSSNLGASNNRASEKGRGGQSSRWSVKRMIESGFALVTVYYGDIDPDYDDGFKNGIHFAFRGINGKAPAPDEWGSIAGWAYGLSRVVDFLESFEPVDASKVFVFGHSRLGKTALWAGATDSRYAGVISNNSGCGGAALSKRTFGETVKRINTSFPHWFCDNFLEYNDNEKALPVDQHMLIALSAPTPVYVASASKDLWADPRGEFLSTKYASPVYRLLTGKGFGIEAFPGPNQPSIGVLSYHIREGGHDVTDYDWANYVEFARKSLQ